MMHNNSLRLDINLTKAALDFYGPLNRKLSDTFVKAQGNQTGAYGTFSLFATKDPVVDLTKSMKLGSKWGIPQFFNMTVRSPTLNLQGNA
jgi:hypothetical protein